MEDGTDNTRQSIRISRYTQGMVPVEVAIERLRNPKPGGKIWAAREYGVDLTLLMTNLKRSPAERLSDLQSVMWDLEKLRSSARKRP